MQYLCFPAAFLALFVLSQSNAMADNITLSEPQCECKEKASTLLDVAKDFLKKAKNLYPDCIESSLECGKKQKSLAFLEVASNLITGAKNTYRTCLEPECPKVPDPECPTVPEPVCPTVPEPICPTVPEPECPKDFDEKPIDCSEVLKNGKTTSGVYTIWPKNRTTTAKGLSVYCDMQTDGGGWTVIQRRGKFSTDKYFFDKEWNSYKTGFGDLEEEFWLGNDNIHSISKQDKYTIRFDLKASDGDIGHAEYDTFRIEDELSKYKLHISGYSGSVGDPMENHNNMQFTTKDQNNSRFQRSSCKEYSEGGWWYFDCDWSTMNGLNQPGVDSFLGIIWRTWKKQICLAEVEMKLRPQKL